MGTTSTIATTARSWKMSTPSVACPSSLPVRRSAPSSLSTIAVDDSDTKQPVNTAGRQPTPKAMSSSATAATVPSTCAVPATKISREIRASFSSENSMPIVNNSSTTPTSASWWISSSSATTPSP